MSFNIFNYFVKILTIFIYYSFNNHNRLNFFCWQDFTYFDINTNFAIFIWLKWCQLTLLFWPKFFIVKNSLWRNFTIIGLNSIFLTVPDDLRDDDVNSIKLAEIIYGACSLSDLNNWPFPLFKRSRQILYLFIFFRNRINKNNYRWFI